ncbi:phasin [Bradyrhizobium manausense]|uniref:phasin n=1 Tax=Bradyrhizobium manausense TaxID=989370 RepID=UPI001BAD9E0D|nr:phasin [Bradyrhizobium manausense]MBR0832893.1 phasin [Bradyrhizobium manausense]
MSDANVKAEANAAPLNGMANGSAKLQFDLPFFNIQTVFGNLAEPAAARARANFEQIKATSEEISGALYEACSTNAKRAAEYGTRVVEISNTRTTSALDFIAQLADARSFADLVNLATTHSRKTFEAASAQNQELWDLAQQAAIETTEPIKKSFDRVLHRSS